MSKVRCILFMLTINFNVLVYNDALLPPKNSGRELGAKLLQKSYRISQYTFRNFKPPNQSNDTAITKLQTEFNQVEWSGSKLVSVNNNSLSWYHNHGKSPNRTLHRYVFNHKKMHKCFEKGQTASYYLLYNRIHVTRPVCF